jgi:hypothetical protein
MFKITHDAGGFVRLNISGKVGETEMKDGLETSLAIVETADKSDFLYAIGNLNSRRCKPSP